MTDLSIPPTNKNLLASWPECGEAFNHGFMTIKIRPRGSFSGNWSLMAWRIRKDVRRVDLKSERMFGEWLPTVWIELASVTSIREVADLYKTLTGKEWGER